MDMKQILNLCWNLSRLKLSVVSGRSYLVVVCSLKFTRVPFGNRASPFLLNATVKHHLESYPESKVISELGENLYVDNLLTGCDTAPEGCAMIAKANEVMDAAGMVLSQWASNDPEVADVLSHEFHDRSISDESLKVLGMQWSAVNDCFLFDGVVLPSLCVTKQFVLSCIARQFDPLGLLTPFTIGAKCMLQELWRLGIPWNEVVTDDFGERFMQWLHGLHLLKTWRVPRSYLGSPWSAAVDLQLHAFGDASESAYGACVYLTAVLSDGSRVSSLVMARARVAPLKSVTLPRLELLASLMCARLLCHVKLELRLSDVPCHCWTDSMVTLAWIKGAPHLWKPFVGNRVAEIQSLTETSCWNHCPGEVNPADLVTRGITAEELMSSDVWLHGPSFLLDPNALQSMLQRGILSEPLEGCIPEARHPKPPDIVLITTVTAELKQKDVVEETSGESTPLASYFHRWSSFTKVIRVVGWIRRFCHNVRQKASERLSGDLSYKEMCEAKKSVLHAQQMAVYAAEFHSVSTKQLVPEKSVLFKLSPFMDCSGLLCVRGRLQFSSLSDEAKYPIIVPKCHLGLLLVRHVHHVLKHAGVNAMLVHLRDRYWVIGARRFCKQVRRECISCKIQSATPGSEPMAPLPRLRVTQAPVFAVVGIDHAGPLYCCDTGGSKFYILLFTCAVVRAVHLELVTALSAEATLAAIRRFAARRGMPSHIMSDNAKGFIAAKDLVLELYGATGPEWHFIVPRAAWWGGFWEIQVKTIKSSLKRTIGTRRLSRVELETTLHEVEACINSRPLTFSGDDLESFATLTPSHFLVGRASSMQPVNVPAEVPSTVKAENLVMREECRTQALNEFWSCWSSEYLRNLPPCTGSSVSKGGIRVGAVVMIHVDNSPRLQWPWGWLLLYFLVRMV